MHVASSKQTFLFSLINMDKYEFRIMQNCKCTNLQDTVDIFHDHRTDKHNLTKWEICLIYQLMIYFSDNIWQTASNYSDLMIWLLLKLLKASISHQPGRYERLGWYVRMSVVINICTSVIKSLKVHKIGDEQWSRIVSLT